MKKIQRLAIPVVTAYLWVMMILLGAIVLETFMIYPNVFVPTRPHRWSSLWTS